MANAISITPADHAERADAARSKRARVPGRCRYADQCGESCRGMGNPDPVAFPGALSNPETSAVLRKLVEVVRAAAARPEPEERPKAERGRRPGWVAPLVLAVLASAAEPMTPLEIVREIEQRFGEHPAHPSVVSALRYGKEAQLGLIERAGGGRYLARRAI